MALFKTGFQMPDGRQFVVFAHAESESAVSDALISQGIAGATYIVPVPDDKWFSTDRDGLMVTQEEGDVEYTEPIMQFPESEVDMWGNDSASEALIEAGVNLGYREVAAVVAATDEAVAALGGEVNLDDQDAVAAYAVGLDKAAAEAMGEPFYPGDEVIIRRALESTLGRIRYLKSKVHDLNAEAALGREYEEVSQTLIRWDVEHPGAKLAI